MVELANRGLRPTVFLSAMTAEIVREQQRRGHPVRAQPRGRLVKFWFGGDPSIHYEVWIHERAAKLELGPHFESSPDVNAALYRLFDGALLEIRAQLGDTLWLEEWDRGWTRIYETQPLWPLDNARAHAVAARMCELIGVLQPIYEELSLSIPIGLAPTRRQD
jgi:hypothetical protein